MSEASSSSTLLSRLREWQQHLSLGARLTLTILPLVMIPMLVLASVNYFRSRSLLENQATSQMLAAAQAQIGVLNEWTGEREQRLQLGSQRSALREAGQELFTQPQNSARYLEARETARAEMVDLRLRQGQPLFTDLALVRGSDGLILASTNPALEGQASPFLVMDNATGESLHSHPIFDDPILAQGELAVITHAPLSMDAGSENLVELVGINSGTRLGALFESMQIFWERRGVYRVERGRTYALLAPDIMIQLERYATAPNAVSMQQHPVFSQAAEALSGTVEFRDADGVLVLAAYEWIEEWGLGIVAELPQSDIFAEVNDLAPFTIALLIGVTALVALVVPFFTGRAIKPLSTLSDLAERFAHGDMSARVASERGDEIGMLSRTFNHMAGELSSLYRSLEQRVEERTQQIRTASEVARDAIAIRDVESLLNETVNLITARFGFYHAGVFLLDSARQNAVLRAASSEGGKRMIERGHELAVGKVGIVGYVTGTGKPRIALDVGADQVHFANPELPATRSELALPLWSGDEIIGALDVQSTDPNAFDDEDVIVLQTMADQLAVAIQNARLIEELTNLSGLNQKVIQVYTQLSQHVGYDSILSEASRLLQSAFGFKRVAIGIMEANEIVVRSAFASEDIDAAPLGIPVPLDRGPLGKAINLGEPVMVSAGGVERYSETPANGASATTIAVPLISRGIPLGAIAIESQDHDHFSAQLVEILELIASQIAASLENARLFEETQQSLDQLDRLYRRQTATSWEDLLELLGEDKAATFAEFRAPRYPAAVVDGGDPLDAPIEVRGEIVGRLNLLAEKPGAWTEDDREILTAVAEEVSNALEQMRLYEDAQRKATQLQTAAEVARDATGLLDIRTLLRRTVNLIRDRFGYEHVSIFLIDPEGTFAEVSEATGEAGEAMKSTRHRLAVGSQSIIGQVTQTGEHYLANDVQSDPFFRPHELLPQTRSELGIALKVGQRVIGALDVQHHALNAFSEDDLAVLHILADQLAVAIQNARLFEETLSRARREQTVLELTSEVRAQGNMEGMMRSAVTEMRRAFGASRGRIRLFNQDVEGSPVGGSGVDGAGGNERNRSITSAEDDQT
jgi:GAF domain-containing protein/HAMP domain-containing protein